MSKILELYHESNLLDHASSGKPLRLLVTGIKIYAKYTKTPLDIAKKYIIFRSRRVQVTSADTQTTALSCHLVEPSNKLRTRTKYKLTWTTGEHIHFPQEYFKKRTLLDSSFT
jgi:hypothetical protein